MDIIERLRPHGLMGQSAETRLRQEAADEIERLREALRTIGYGPPNEGEPLELLNQFVDLARSTLQQKDSE